MRKGRKTGKKNSSYVSPRRSILVVRTAIHRYKGDDPREMAASIVIVA
ncbi:hypothetical protein B4113_0479 [Geobacillus sp. B4113_201601]|nr:hypothetical protein B4113_0479 [Geobacillus sp. B4113_201601]